MFKDRSLKYIFQNNGCVVRMGILVMENMVDATVNDVEHRKNVRTKTLIGATIVFNHSYSTLDCKVRNISRCGAKIEVAALVTLPLEFELRLPQRGIKRGVRIVWRRGLEIGVIYTNRPCF